jgi:hypothetical protein
MSDALKISQPVQNLLNRGVIIPCPFSVEVEKTVNPGRISPGVIIHTGCRIAGATTSIGPGSELGKEAPVALDECQLGHNVQLKGGFFSGATFLDGANLGSAAHVRPGTLLEEGANGAHAVGLKQTIFLSFVTAGSLINFCDALMAGGTGRKNHSEIGSSYIHFNFTPHQDKATPSLIGDVPHGVFLDQPPIFLGGQGGLVGPSRIAYGTVIAAGTICRQDILEQGNFFVASEAATKGRVLTSLAYRGINRIVVNNLIYIGNLWALHAWYRLVRMRVMSTDVFRQACHIGALAQIEDGLKERIKRLKELKELVEKRALSLKRKRTEAGEDPPPRNQLQRQAFVSGWPEMEERLTTGPPADLGAADLNAFLKKWEQADISSGYIEAVNALSPSARKAGVAWLQQIVDSAAALWTGI